MNQVGNGLVGEESYNSIKEFCSDRINKYGLTTPNHGACKGCPYRYKGYNKLMCCIFANLPYTW